MPLCSEIGRLSFPPKNDEGSCQPNPPLYARPCCGTASAVRADWNPSKSISSLLLQTALVHVPVPRQAAAPKRLARPIFEGGSNGLSCRPVLLSRQEESAMIADMRTSVVIPARDAEKTISQTLDSLLVQTDRGWEALIVDDGS